MIFLEKRIALKNGREYLLRSPDGGDADLMLEYLRQCAAETEFVIRYPEEFWESAADEAAILAAASTSETSLMISCLDNGKIVGNCGLTFNKPRKLRHRATVGIGILKPYWGMGMASAMMQEAIAAAQSHPYAQVLELGYMEGNLRAEGLYRRLGFVQTLVIPNAFRLDDGSFKDEVLMALRLHRQ